MHFSIIFAACVMLSATQRITWRAQNFSSVVHFEDIEAYYLNRRQQALPFIREGLLGARFPPTEPYDVEERKRLQKVICKSILTSHFFRMRQIEWIDVNLPEIQEDLRINHRDIFDSIYIEMRRPSSRGFVGLYRNSYRKRRIRVHGADEVRDHVFKCPARDLNQPGTVKEYFVSRAYDVNVVSPRNNDLGIAGRFIFLPDENDIEMLTIVALAEEPALGAEIVRTSGFITLGYMWNRYSQRRIGPDTPEQDPVCSLTPAHKLRLCSVILSQRTFLNEITFLPIADSVAADCERRTVSITLLNRVFRRPHQEWVIGCKALLNTTHETVTYYVSRAGKANSVFVYSDAGNQMILLYNFYVLVSVVGDLVTEDNENVPEGGNPQMRHTVLVLTQLPGDVAVPPPGVRFLYNDVED